MKRLFLLPVILAAPTAALAHGGTHNPGAGTPGWTWDPWLTIPLGLALLCYLLGFVRLRNRATLGRGVLWRGFILFTTGWLILALSLLSPLHEGGERSFAIHMIEHELIMLVAALLLPLSRPLATMLWALPRSIRHALADTARTSWISMIWRHLTNPVKATALQALALWAWHAPPLFNRALGHPGWHIAQHLCFLLTALLFWWAMSNTRNTGLAALCLFLTSVIGGALGALMALSSSPWYAGYAAMHMMPFGLPPAQDQQLAGVIMWVPGGLVHAGAALVLLGRYLGRGGKCFAHMS